MPFTDVLITRPEPQLSELAAWFEEEGLSPIRLPAFSFQAREESVGPDEEWTRAGNRLLIFTSPRAVQFGFPAVEGRMFWGSRVASLGPATTRALSEAGIDALQASGPNFDSEALLALVDESLEPGAAVILAAPGGRLALKEGLESRGWDVRMALVYDRQLLAPGAGAVEALEAAGELLSIWTSATALSHVLSQVSGVAADRIRAGTGIVVSDRLAKQAKEQGIEHIVVADGASNGDLLKAFQALNN